MVVVTKTTSGDLIAVSLDHVEALQPYGDGSEVTICTLQSGRTVPVREPFAELTAGLLKVHGATDDAIRETVEMIGKAAS